MSEPTTMVRVINPIKILVVEDDAVIASVMLAALGDEGMTVLRARDGDEAVALIKRESPDVVLLDLMMPNRDGFSVLRELRGNGKSIDVPIIVTSAIFGTSEKMYATELGAVDYMTKPFQIAELVDRVRKHARTRAI